MLIVCFALFFFATLAIRDASSMTIRPMEISNQLHVVPIQSFPNDFNLGQPQPHAPSNFPDLQNDDHWFGNECCNNFDCQIIPASIVKATPEGYVIEGRPNEIIPYDSKMIKNTPEKGGGRYAICTRGGKFDAKLICLYIPPQAF